MEPLAFARQVFASVPAYRRFVAAAGLSAIPDDWTRLPVMDKEHYLLAHPIEDLCHGGSLAGCHLLGASSGFSRTGSLFWPKRPVDEGDYLASIGQMLVKHYGIDQRRTLVLVCLAFGTWIGGMQIAAALRALAASGRYPLTLATPGLNLREAATLYQRFHAHFVQCLVITNPSNIPLLGALIRQGAPDAPLGPSASGTGEQGGCRVFFPVVGEFFSEAFRERVARDFGHAEDAPFCVWTGYGSADTGDLGVETAATIALRKWFHRQPELSERVLGARETPMLLAPTSKAYIEILDGEIVVTKDQLIPLVRYNTRDQGGLLERARLAALGVPGELLAGLPERILFVHGRVSDSLVFYGTNLKVQAIGDFLLGLPQRYRYGGLFQVRQVQGPLATRLHFTLFTQGSDELPPVGDYAAALLDFLKQSSLEFAAKYDPLCRAAGEPLIQVELHDLAELDPALKHRYILDGPAAPASQGSGEDGLSPAAPRQESLSPAPVATKGGSGGGGDEGQSRFAWLDESAQLDQARMLWQVAQAAPFYRHKYAGLPEPFTWAGWRALPLLSRQELYDHSWPRSLDLLTVPAEGMILTSTGGTSGLARYNVLTHAEWGRFCDEQARALQRIGVTARDRVANLLVAGSLWPSFLGVHEIIKRIGATHLPISANIPIEKILRFCREFQPTVMISLPTLFVFLADLALKEGLRFPELRLIAYAGEPMSPSVREHVRRGLGEQVAIHALAYTSADAGLMGYQCLHCAPNVYHVPTAFQLIEIIDLERDRPTQPGEIGELLVTNLARTSQPLIRYRIGDRGAWTGQPCACGDPNPLLRLAGRAGDDFKLGGAYIAIDQVERAVETVVGQATISPNYTLVIADEGQRLALELHIEAGDPALAAPYAGQVISALESVIPELGIARAKDYLARLEVRFVALGSLERSPITGKVRRLHDRRIEETAP